MKEIVIDPITRLEGHGNISLFLNDAGEVENAYLKIPELRGFEQFCIGRRAELMPILTTRICGVCPVAHHFAATKALDAAFNVEPPSAAKKLRELMYSAYYIYDHTLHFYYLGGPDFVVGPDAPPEKRNIIGVIEKAGLEVGKEVIKHRAYGQKMTEIIGGKATHPVCGLPGGVSKPLSEENRAEIEKMAESCLKFAQFTLKLFHDIVLGNSKYVDLIMSQSYTHKTYYMGLVDEKNRVNFYDGKLRVTSPSGKEFAKFDAHEYLEHIAEHVEPWTYVKFPFLKKVGWKGFVEGEDSGVMCVAPLARLNASDGMATPRAQEAYEEMFKTLGGKPVHYTLANHWARIVEMIYAAERLRELAYDPEITDPNIRNLPTATPEVGIGVDEAPRGTLIHHYETDARGVVKKANLLVATQHNSARMALSVDKAARSLIKGGKVDDGMLNMVEMAFRAYDPCHACGTHSLPGSMPFMIYLYNEDGALVRTVKRNMP